MYGKLMWCALAASILVTGQLEASTFEEPVSLARLAERAEGAYLGTVTAVSARAIDSDHLETIVAFQVQQSVFGPAEDGETLRIIHPGGSLDERVDHVSGAPRFHVGERVLVFIQSTADDECIVLESARGKLTVLKDPTTGQDLVRSTGTLSASDSQAEVVSNSRGLLAPDTIALNNAIRLILGSHVP